MRLFFPLLTIILLISGCHSPEEPLPYPITLSSEGLGPLHPGESFEISAIQGKLPGFTVEKMSLVTPGRSETLLLLKRGESVLAHILPGSDEKQIAQITLCSDRIKDQRGQTIGETIQKSSDLHCNGSECRYGADESLSYRIDPGSGIIREITLQKL